MLKLSPKWNRVWPAAMVPACLAMIADGCGGGKTTESAAEKHRSVTVGVTTVERSVGEVGYEATGTVKAVLRATMSSKVLARVVAVHVRAGDVVTKGQVLISLDSRELASAVAVADAGYRSSVVGVANAQTVAQMESRTSAARISQAAAQVSQAVGALSASKARLALALEGPRVQEKQQARLAVQQAASTLKLAKAELDRVSTLVREGAFAARQLDVAQNAYDVAKAQYDTAVQSEAMAREGTRSQAIGAAKDAVAQAEGALREAKAGLVQARAAALQAKVRRGEVDAARAQVRQSAASLQSSRVGLAYATVVAPFDGRIVDRTVDPGSMASPGAPLLTIEGGGYRLEAAVPESVLSFVPLGTSASARIDALQGVECKSRAVEIVPQGDSSTHSFVVKFRIGAPPGLRSGMFGRVNLAVGKRSAILIPVSAAWEREGLHYVFAVNGEHVARLRIVSLGRTTGDKVEVLAGLAPGDRIVSDHTESVSDGDVVEARR